jgi:hypothetical protein
MSAATLPDCQTLLLRRDGWRLHVTLNRPESRNAMSFAMVRELTAVFTSLQDDRSVRAVVLRGAGGNFCAGGDIKDMAAARGAEPGPDGRDPLALSNRSFGAMLLAVEAAPQAVVAVVEGAVMGGGFGLCCVSDVAIAHAAAKFRLPETGLGVPPAQIAPFIVRRVGLTQARRLAVTGGALDAAQALALGLDPPRDRKRQVRSTTTSPAPSPTSPAAPPRRSPRPSASSSPPPPPTATRSLNARPRVRGLRAGRPRPRERRGHDRLPAEAQPELGLRVATRDTDHV